MDTLPIAEWPALVPLASAALPDFPVEALPEHVARFAESIAGHTETPVDLAGMLALAAMSAAIAGRAEVLVSLGHVECLSLYVVVAMRSGTRKSAVFSEVFSPLKLYEADVRSRLRDEVNRAFERRKSIAVDMEHLRKSRARESEDARVSRVARFETLRKELLNSPEPVQFLLSAEDVTPETLATLVSEQQGALALFSPEGGGVFDMMAGRYSKTGTPNFDLFLKGWSGEGTRVHRRGRFEDIERVTLTLALATQPGTMEVLGGHSAFTDRGLSARCLFSLPEDRLGRRTHRTKPVSELVTEEYHRSLRQVLAGCEDREGGAQRPIIRIALSTEARALWHAFQVAHEPKLAETAELGHMSAWGSKLPGTLARISALIHVVECGGIANAGSLEVSAETMQRALDLAAYLIAHARAAFGQMDADPVLGSAQRVWRWIKSEHLVRFSSAEAALALRGTFRKVSNLTPGLEALERFGYIRRLPDPPREPGQPGRPPSPSFEIRPELIENTPNNPNNPGPQAHDHVSADSSDSSRGSSVDCVAQSVADELVASSTPGPCPNCGAENWLLAKGCATCRDCHQLHLIDRAVTTVAGEARS